MKKQAEVRDDNRITIIPEYGRQRLLTYAESFRDLADLFEGDDVKPEKNTGMDDPVDRQDYLWQRKLQENQGLLAEHLKEMAHIMAEVAQETCLYRPMSERKYKQISKLLRESGILLKNFFELEREDGHVEISLTMKMISEKYTKLGENICIDDVADFISVAMNIRLHAAKNTPQYLTPEWNTYRGIIIPSMKRKMEEWWQSCRMAWAPVRRQARIRNGSLRRWNDCLRQDFAKKRRYR